MSREKFYTSTGPAGFSSHTEVQPTLVDLIVNDGGYSFSYGCNKVVHQGKRRITTYYEPKVVQRYSKIFKNQINELRNMKRWL